ncbi:MAG: PhnD/SsuA/transferrin family substrate-binding protein [Rhizobiaceae bacterium]|nr:PhnD/SsuA/transferrin family substrate-binding protein [Rhizobiaceae bacterium]
MTDHIAALPMYDWSERQSEVDAEWAAISERMRAAGIPSPLELTRRNSDMPAVEGGIADVHGMPLAPDPATLPPDELHLPAVWNHPKLIFGQTCWGPIELGLIQNAIVIGQPDYSGFEGGHGELYSSAIVMSRVAASGDVPPRSDGAAIPVDRLRGRRFVFNSSDSMSGVIALSRDLEAMGESLDIFSERFLSGGHRNSIIAVASGEAEVAAIDCTSWALAKRHEPAAEELQVVGWTAPRKGLPFIASRHLPANLINTLRRLCKSRFRA